jgi:fructose-bisphosphate aldolase class 1
MTGALGTLDDTLRILLTPGKGMIAPDEHPDRLAEALGVDVPDAHTRSRHRAMVLATPSLERWISAAVVDADALQIGLPGRGPAGPIIGVRLGSDTDNYRHGGSLAGRRLQIQAALSLFREEGARFVKWRADLDPMRGAASAYVDTRYLAACAALSIRCDLVPVLDVAMPNQRTHSLSVATAVTANALTALFAELVENDADPARVLVRMNMVRAGVSHELQTSHRQVGITTLRVLDLVMPDEAPGVMFMSTGMSAPEACADLAAISAQAMARGWQSPFTFGFSRALLHRGTRAWVRDGDAAAQELIAQDCAAASAATSGSLLAV